MLGMIDAGLPVDKTGLAKANLLDENGNLLPYDEALRKAEDTAGLAKYTTDIISKMGVSDYVSQSEIRVNSSTG